MPTQVKNLSFQIVITFVSDEPFRVKSTKLLILSGVLLLLVYKKSLRCLVLILDFKIFHLGQHRKKIRL
jgi:hypothetical protein